MRAALLLLGACSSTAPPPPAQPTAPPSDAAPPVEIRRRPVNLVIRPLSLVLATAPTNLMVPLPIAVEVERRGRERLIYVVSVCSGPSLIVHSVETSTGIPELDHFVDKQLGIFIAPPRSGCTTVTLVLSFHGSYQFTTLSL